MIVAQQASQVTDLIRRFLLPWLKANGIDREPAYIGVEKDWTPTEEGAPPFQITYTREGHSETGINAEEVIHELMKGKDAFLNSFLFQLQDYYGLGRQEPRVSFASMFFPETPEPVVSLVGEEIHPENPSLPKGERFFASNGSDGQLVANASGGMVHLAEGVEVIFNGHRYRYIAAGPFTRLFMMVG